MQPFSILIDMILVACPNYLISNSFSYFVNNPVVPGSLPPIPLVPTLHLVLSPVKLKKPNILNNRDVQEYQAFIPCPGLESNQHSPKGTAPSRQRVYQFRHQGRGIIVLKGFKYRGINNYFVAPNHAKIQNPNDPNSKNPGQYFDSGVSNLVFMLRI